MSFDVQEFANNPRLATLAVLNNPICYISVANHYKVEVSSTIQEADLRKAISEYLVDEKIVSDKEYEPTTDVELKKCELMQQERERESQMRIKELEIRERKLSIQLKAKELEVARTLTSEASRREKFDMSKHISFVPPFQDTEVDKYLLHFEKIASSMEWLKEVWILLLQSVLLGKAREVYSAQSVIQSLDYDVVKTAILKAWYQKRIDNSFVVVEKRNLRPMLNLHEQRKICSIIGVLPQRLIQSLISCINRGI